MLLENLIAGGEKHCKGGLQLVLAWRWWRCVFRECHAVFLGNVIAGRQTHCNGGFKVALGCRWWRCVIGECNRRKVEKVKILIGKLSE